MRIDTKSCTNRQFRPNSSRDMIFFSSEFWYSDIQTDRQKATSNIPPSISTGGLKNSKFWYFHSGVNLRIPSQDYTDGKKCVRVALGVPRRSQLCACRVGGGQWCTSYQIYLGSRQGNVSRVVTRTLNLLCQSAWQLLVWLRHGKPKHLRPKLWLQLQLHGFKNSKLSRQPYTVVSK